MTREQVLTWLDEQVDTARKRRDATSAQFDELLREAPRSIPFPDSTESVRLASREFSAAQKQLTDAIVQRSQYLLHGILPAELRESDGGGATLQREPIVTPTPPA